MQNSTRLKTALPRSKSLNRHAHPEGATSAIGENTAAYEG
jgi:hypothetical protein